MKKISIIIFAVLGLLNVTSCSSDDQNTKDESQALNTQQLFQQLRDSVNSLNSRYINYKGTKAPRIYTRREKLYIYFADAIGAALEKLDGGDDIQVILRSAEFSLMAKEHIDAQGLSRAGGSMSHNPIDCIKANPFVGIVFNTEGENDSIGLFHNKLVYYAKLNYVSCNVDTLSMHLCNYYANEKGVQASTMQSQIAGNLIFLNSLLSYKNIIDSDSDYTQLCTYIRNQTRNSEVVSFIEDYIDTIIDADETTTNLYEYTYNMLDYIDKIKKINSDNSWDALQAGIIVAYASYNLWNIN